MSENHLSFQICRTTDEIESAKDAYEAVLAGLGNNILSKLGNVELGRTVQIFMRNMKNEVVGGSGLYLRWLDVYLALVVQRIVERQRRRHQASPDDRK